MTNASPNGSTRAFIALQRLLPQHGLSRFAGVLARSEAAWIRKPLVHLFARIYPVDMSEAARGSLDDYRNFNDFFTRELRADARPLARDLRYAVSPADGLISQAGTISDGRLLQAKGHGYSLSALLGGTERAAQFEGGSFATIYLAPHDYHRVHLPISGALVETCAIPGALYSVNATTEAHIEGLFARNERLVCHFETSVGPLAVILVGAMIVAGIQTAWNGPASPYRELTSTRHAGLRFERGAEIGRFFLGSTVIVCLPRGVAELAPGVTTGATIRMGRRLFRLY